MSNTLGKNAAILTVSKIMTTAISLVSAMLLSRFRDLQEYGTYSQILLVINLFTALFMLGLPNSTNYFLALSDTPEKRWHFLSVYYTLNTILCLIMGVALAISVPLIVSYFKNPLIRDFTYILVLLPWTKIVISSISNILVVYGRTGQLTLFNVINAAVALLSILITKLFGWSFQEYMLLYLIGEGGMMVAVYVIVWRLERPLKICFDTQLVKTIFTYSVPIGLAALVGTLDLEIDKLMIGGMLDTEQLAIYTNAAKELPLTIVASSLTAVLLPQMARMLKNQNAKDAISLWGDTVCLSYMIICFFASALIAFAPQVITILYSEKYLPGVPVFRVYSAVLLLRCTYFGIVLNSIGKTKPVFYTSILSLGLNAVMNYTFFRAFGMIGPAIATFFSIAIAGFVQLYITSKTLAVELRKLLPWRSLAKITLINALLCGAWSAVKAILRLGTSVKDIIVAVILGMIGTLGYALALRKRIISLWRAINSDRKVHD